MDSNLGISPKVKHKKEILLWFIYALITGFLLYFHEAGRDEWQGIGIARNLFSLQDFLTRMRAEGHPFLSFIIFKYLLLLHNSINTIKVFNWVIMLIAAWILLFKIQIDHYLKIVFLFGYFMLYEYAAIVRAYGMMSMLILLCVYQLQKKERCNYFILLLGMAGMIFNHIYGIMISAGILFYIYYPFFHDYKKLFSHSRENLLLIGTLLCMSISIYCVWPQHQDYFYPDHRSGLLKLITHFPKAIGMVWNAMFNIPAPIIDFRNVNLIDYLVSNAVSIHKATIISNIIKSILMIPMGYFLFLMAKENKRAVLTLIFTWLLIMIFQIEVFWGLLRHNGFFYLSFFGFLCLLESTIKNNLKIFVVCMMSTQLVSSILAICMEMKYDYCGATPAAKYINNLSNGPFLIECNSRIDINTLQENLKKETVIYVNGKILNSKFIPWEQLNPNETHEQEAHLGWQLRCQRDIAFNPDYRNFTKILVLNFDPRQTGEKETLDSLINNGNEFIAFDHTINAENFYVLKMKD